MKDLLFFLRLTARKRLGSRMGGAHLAFATLFAGRALLGLSGGFISAAALAGLAGAGSAFNLFVPSAGVRFFAIGRIVARYLERLVTHEATLRILADLRVWFFQKAIPLAPARLGELRGGDVVARVTSDIEALDNLYLRALAPAVAAFLLTLSASVFPAFFDLRLGLLVFVAMTWRRRACLSRPTPPGRLRLSGRGSARCGARWAARRGTPCSQRGGICSL